MRADVIADSLRSKYYKKEKEFIYLSPKGKKFDQNLAKELSKEKSIYYLWAF